MKEEIQEGIADILEVWMDRDLALTTARTIMAKEAYQGVVIKVDRELPENPTSIPNLLGGVGIVEQLDAVSFQAYRDAQRDMLDDKFLAVEDLI